MHNLFSTSQFSMRTHDAYKTCMKFLLNFNLSLILLYKYGKKYALQWICGSEPAAADFSPESQVKR